MQLALDVQRHRLFAAMCLQQQQPLPCTVQAPCVDRRYLQRLYAAYCHWYRRSRRSYKAPKTDELLLEAKEHGFSEIGAARNLYKGLLPVTYAVYFLRYVYCYCN